MNILDVENQTIDLNQLPELDVSDLRFAVLDNSDIQNPDFFFLPLVYLEIFNSPAMVLSINEHEIVLPIDWHIAIGDNTTSCDIEIMPLTSLNNRGFSAMVFNPLTSFRLEFKPIEIINFYNDVKWYTPKMKANQLLAMPISEEDESDCIFIIRDIGRLCDQIKLDRLP